MSDQKTEEQKRKDLVCRTVAIIFIAAVFTVAGMAGVNASAVALIVVSLWSIESAITRQTDFFKGEDEAEADGEEA